MRTKEEEDRNDRVLISVLLFFMLVYLGTELIRYVKYKRSLSTTVEQCRTPLLEQTNGHGKEE